MNADSSTRRCTGFVLGGIDWGSPGRTEGKVCSQQLVKTFTLFVWYLEMSSG